MLSWNKDIFCWQYRFGLLWFSIYREPLRLNADFSNLYEDPFPHHLWPVSWFNTHQFIHHAYCQLCHKWSMTVCAFWHLSKAPLSGTFVFLALWINSVTSLLIVIGILFNALSTLQHSDQIMSFVSSFSGITCHLLSFSFTPHIQLSFCSLSSPHNTMLLSSLYKTGTVSWIMTLFLTALLTKSVAFIRRKFLCIWCLFFLRFTGFSVISRTWITTFHHSVLYGNFFCIWCKMEWILWFTDTV